jgi:membrane-bound serine protease (ClpP class)
MRGRDRGLARRMDRSGGMPGTEPGPRVRGWPLAAILLGVLAWSVPALQAGGTPAVHGDPAFQDAPAAASTGAGAEAEPQDLAQAPARHDLGPGPVMRIPIQGIIELGLAPFVERSLREAASLGAAAVILDIETPGGRVDAAERIVDAVSDSEVPVFAFVNRRAISAGAMISLATVEIFMRPGSTMGASTPVDGTGEKAPEKIVSVMRSSMRSLAEARGLDPAIAEAMVDEEIEVPGVVEAGRLLTLTYSDAADLGYATVVEDWNALLSRLGLEGRAVVEQEVNWAERTVRFLSHPIVAPFLLSLGFLGLLVEIKTPGFGVAGAAGVLSLALFFGSHMIIGLAGAEGLLLFGAGVILLLVEIFLLPGVGVFAVLGGIAMLAGIYLSLLGGIPVAGDYARASTVLAATLTLVIASSWALVRHLPQNRRLTRLGIFLGTATDRETGYTSAVRRGDLKGAVGTAVTDLRPSGTGLFGDERIDVVADSEWIEAGSPIRIIASEGYRHVVRRAEPARSDRGAIEGGGSPSSASES